MNVERGGEPNGPPRQRVGVTLAAILFGLVVAAGCTTDQEGGGRVAVVSVPVSVSATIDDAGETVRITLKNLGDQQTFLEPLFFSSQHWRGYAGGGKWGLDAEHVVSPDFLVLVGEDGGAVPWLNPLWNGTYSPGFFMSNDLLAPGRFVDPGRSTHVDIALDGFRIGRAQDHWIIYQVYGVQGRVGPLPLQPSNDSHAPDSTEARGLDTPLLGLDHVRTARRTSDPLLTLDLVNRGSSEVRVASAVRCNDGNETKQGPAVTWAKVTSRTVDAKPLACASHDIAVLNSTLGVGASVPLTFPRALWSGMSGAQALHVGLDIDVCELASCAQMTWLVRCVYQDGLGQELAVPSPGSKRDEQYTDPTGGAEPDFYMMGVPLRPWSCDVFWG